MANSVRWADKPFDPVVAEEILFRIANGESLVRICKDEHMPSTPDVYRWISGSDDFRSKYARARDDQADTIFDEIQHIADTPILGIVRVTKSTGVEITEADAIAHRRLQIDVRKWRAGKLRPKKYGEIKEDPDAVKESGDIRIHGGLPDA